MELISPWTGWVVHAAHCLRGLALFVGVVGVGVLFATVVAAMCESVARVRPWMLGASVAVAVAATITVLVPPDEVLARTLVVHQLPPGADVNVDDLVHRLVVEAGQM